MNREAKESLHIAEHLLTSHGHSVRRTKELMQNLTLIVDGTVKIAIRKSALHREGSPFFQFKITNYERVDYALLIGVMHDESLRVYIVPKEALKEHMRVGITSRSAFRQYLDEWGLLSSEDACLFSSPTMEDCRMCPKMSLGWCKACKQWCYFHRWHYSESFDPWNDDEKK